VLTLEKAQSFSNG